MAPVGVEIGWLAAPAMSVAGACMVRVRCVAHDSDKAQVLGLVYCKAGERQVFIYAQPDGASRRRDWMAPRARDGELYFADGIVAGACVVLVRCGVIYSDKAQVLGLVYCKADDR